MPKETQTPLTETVYYTLLALGTPLHGYGIMQRVAEMSGGRVRLGAGTLYGALATLAERGWIVGVGDGGTDRRKDYVITEAGRAVVTQEISRLQELLAAGGRFEGGNGR
ncbi:MAG: helix-turn-helix transcriptional regulator [Coriobacteriia bacterium]|nr:helix-turn-helix transcriptional regulator [Coriobacteriia bacterium]